MNKKTVVLKKLMICAIAIALLGSLIGDQARIAQVADEPAPLSITSGTLISETNEDKSVIPDKYNTGTKGELTLVSPGETVNGILLSGANNGTAIALDFPRKNPNVGGTITFENIDFSMYSVVSYHEGEISSKIKVIFKNCKFSKVTTGKAKGNISFEFNNCTFNGFSGSNTVFNNCAFGKSYSDGLVPYCNVTVNNCYFCDMASTSEDGAGKHTDGTQIYGFKDLDVTDVYYNNCRFEVPAIQTGSDSASINACIMLQLEYSNASNVKFSNCIINGGGYSIFARATGQGLNFTNVRFENIKIGCSMLFGSFYPMISSQISFDNVEATQNLYVGSVWKEDGNTHLSVTNDTNQERQLLIYADGKIYKHTIQACPDGKHLLSQYSDFPFDIDIVIPGECNYVVCYDNTIEGMPKQVRYENWSGESLYLDKDTKRAIYGTINTADDIVISGSCGNDIEYKLTKSGKLVLSGTGATDNYHSAKLPPWSEYINLIHEIEINDGIECIGTQIFKGCMNVKKVILADGLTTISSRAFYNCSTLQDIVIPNSIKTIGDYAFSGTLIQNAHYLGDSSEWETVSIGQNNEAVKQNVIIDMGKNNLTQDMQPLVPLIAVGDCGKEIRFELAEDGVLRLIGKGATYDYHSLKVAPWFEYRDIIKKVEISEGITALGNQVFRQCRNLDKVDLPDSLLVIGNNAFIQCKSLYEIVIPDSVNSIRRYAFHNTGLCHVMYMGTETEWADIYVGEFNEKLQNTITFIRK